ncbi:MAG: dihydrodipicolinate synthase family protein [Bacteroidota bacterium]
MGGSSMFKGVVTALLTPYDEQGAVAEKALRKHVDFLIEAGVQGLYPCGSAGEGIVLPVAQRQRVAEIVLDQVGGRIPVMMHVGAVSTEDTVELARHAKNLGAQAIGVVAPCFYTYGPEQLARHFRLAAEAAAPLPVYLYNIPGNAKNEVTPKLAAELVRTVPNIVGIKDSSKSIAKLMAFVETLGEEAEILVGSDDQLLPAVAVGAKGIISALSNVIPEIMVALYEASAAGDWAKARKLQADANAVRNLLKSGPDIASYKFAVRWRGNEEFRGMRGPLTDVSSEDEAQLRAGLEAAAAKGLIRRRNG